MYWKYEFFIDLRYFWKKIIRKSRLLKHNSYILYFLIWILEISTRYFSGFSNPVPDPRDFGIFVILHSGFFGIFKSLGSYPDPWDFGIYGIFRSSPK